MNAQSAIRPQRDNYIPMVRSFLPGCDGEELVLRCSILLIRDRAMGAMTYCTEEALGLIEHVHRLASEYAFASMSLPRLKEIRRILLMTTANASALQVWINDLAHSEASDGRG